MYNTMKKLIQKRFYKTAEVVENKIDVFFAVARLTEDQYTELAMLIQEVYGE